MSRREAKGEWADVVSGNAKPQLGGWLFIRDSLALPSWGSALPGGGTSRERQAPAWRVRGSLAELGLSASCVENGLNKEGWRM